MIILAKNAGTALADDDGICAQQSVAAGGDLVLAGSLTVGGVFENPGWGYKVKITSVADESGSTFTFAGEFWPSNATGSDDMTVTMAITGPNATSATSSLYATKITGGNMGTASAGSLSVGLAADGSGVPVGLPYGSLYQIETGGTFAGATATVKKYSPLNAEFISLGTGAASATLQNYELPSGSVCKVFVTDGSATTSLGVAAEIISKTR